MAIRSRKNAKEGSRQPVDRTVEWHFDLCLQQRSQPGVGSSEKITRRLTFERNFRDSEGLILRRFGHLKSFSSSRTRLSHPAIIAPMKTPLLQRVVCFL